MSRAFDSLHPAVSFVFFLCAVGFSMCCMNPVMLLISFISSLLFLFVLTGEKSLKYLLFSFPAAAAVAAVNTAFNHRGATILLYVNGNPITLESIVYGTASGIMLMSVIIWFACLNRVMTSDKLIYLFARVSPSLSLLFSMILRFVPKMKRRAKHIASAQKCSGAAAAKTADRIKNSLSAVVILISWSFEDAADTADSMKCRGYGLPGRSVFYKYSLTLKDVSVLAAIILFAAFSAAGGISGAVYVSYFPAYSAAACGGPAFFTYAAYAVLLNIPLGLCLTEELKWCVLKSKI